MEGMTPVRGNMESNNAPNEPIDYSFAARKRFPLSKDIRGTGKFCLVSRCYRRWAVRCYQTLELRTKAAGKWSDQGCGSPNCRDDHFTVDLGF